MAELVGLQAQAPDMFGKLSQLLSIQGQRQALAGQAAEVASAQQSQRQRAALAKYDWNKHIGEDGTFDLNSLNDPELRQAAGDQYLDVVTHAVQAKQQQLASKQTLVALRNDQRAAFAEMMGALRSDKDVAEDTDKGRQKVTQAMIQYGEMYGEDVLPVLSAYAAPLQKAPKGRMSDALRAIQLQAHSASQQLEAQQPRYAGTGAELTQINPNAAAGGNIPLTVGPGVQILSDQKGAQFAFNPQTNTVTPVGTGRAGGAPAPNAAPDQPTFSQPSYVGQEHDIATQQQEVANTRSAADQAPANRNIFQHILKLADDTSTGPLVSFLQKNAIGGQVFGDNYQELGKYLEKNAIANMQAMGGPPSDARLSAAVAANGSTQFNPKALKAVTQFNYATNTGLERYRQGMDKAVGTKKPDYGQLPTFKAAWAANFDIDAFRLENAVADGDTAAQREILKDMTPQRRGEVARKMKALDALTETGRVAK
jgi:hypothetical protein